MCACEICLMAAMAMAEEEAAGAAERAASEAPLVRSVAGDGKFSDLVTAVTRLIGAFAVKVSRDERAATL